MSKSTSETAIYAAFDEAAPFDPAAPEKNLLRAVLLNALTDLRKEGDAARRAADYFLSKENDYLFSFQSICNYLRVDADKILMVTGLQKGSKTLTEALAPSEERAASDEVETSEDPEEENEQPAA